MRILMVAVLSMWMSILTGPGPGAQAGDAGARRLDHAPFPEQMEDGRSYLLRYPCKLLTRDLYVRDDVYVSAEPQIRLECPGPMGTPRPRSRTGETRLNTLGMAAPIEDLSFGPGKRVAPGVPEHARLIAHAFEVAGWDAERFRGYRTRIIYPVPMITMGWWIPLPEAG